MKITHPRLLRVLIGAIVVVDILSTGGYLYWQNAQNEQALLQKANQDKTAAQQKASENQKVFVAQQIDTSSWKTYHNDNYGFALGIPSIKALSLHQKNMKQN